MSERSPIPTRQSSLVSLGCTCDPESYEVGPEGQRRYFEDRYCPIHGEDVSARGSSECPEPAPGEYDAYLRQAVDR